MKWNSSLLSFFLFIVFVLVWSAKPIEEPYGARINELSSVASQNLSTAVPKLPYKDMVRMVAKYRDERQAIINSHYSGTSAGQYGANFSDTRYFYFDLDRVQNFITSVQERTSANNLNIGFSGIRIYPIVYPSIGNSDYSDSIPFNQRNHLSLLMVATYKTAEGEIVDYDPDLYDAASNGVGNSPKSLFKPAGKTEEEWLSELFGPGNSIRAFSAMNHAGLCPPPNPCRAALLQNADELCPNGSACQY